MATQYTAGLTTGQVLTAATMNSIGAAWEDYTPTIKGGATTVTAVLNYARYARLNTTIWVQVSAKVTSAGAANGEITLTLPTGLVPAAQGDMRLVGTFIVKDTGTAYYTGHCVITGNIAKGLAYNSANFMGASAPAMTLANNDEVAIELCYQTA